MQPSFKMTAAMDLTAKSLQRGANYDLSPPRPTKARSSITSERETICGTICEKIRAEILLKLALEPCALSAPPPACEQQQVRENLAVSLRINE